MSELECFIVMPVATRPEHEDRYGDSQHWKHVMDTLFIPAIRAAGMKPITPIADGSEMIHGRIIQNLSKADMVLCDLSSHNPNAFFELGVRTSLNRPIALVCDEHTSLPFDTAGINTYKYKSTIKSWEIERDRDNLAEHLRTSVTSCEGENPLWRQFGLTLRAQEPRTDETREEAKLDLIATQMEDLQRQVKHLRPREAAWEIQSGVRSRAHDEEVKKVFIDNLLQTGMSEFIDVIRTGPERRVYLAPNNLATATPLNDIRDLAKKSGVEVIFDMTFEHDYPEKRKP